MADNGLVDYADPAFRRACRAAVKTELTDEQFENFMVEAKARGLNPVLGHLWIQMRWDSKSRTEKPVIGVGIDGFRYVAHQTREYAGQDAPVFVEGHNELPFSCTITVHRWSPLANEKVSYTATIYFDEYCQVGKDKNPTRMWAKMPHAMLAKCAEAVTLRKAFVELGGLYTPDEMAQAANQGDDPPTDQQQAVAAAEKTEAKNNQVAEKTAARAAKNPDDIAARIAGISNMQEALKQLEPNPGAGEATYYDILWVGYGARHANSPVFLNDWEKAAACWKELTRKVNEWKKAATLGVTAEDLEPDSSETSDEIAERKVAELRREKGEPALTVKDFDDNELWLVKAFLKAGRGVVGDDIDPWLADFAGVKGELLAQAESWREKQDDQSAPPTEKTPSGEQGGLGW